VQSAAVKRSRNNLAGREIDRWGPRRVASAFTRRRDGGMQGLRRMHLKSARHPLYSCFWQRRNPRPPFAYEIPPLCRHCAAIVPPLCRLFISEYKGHLSGAREVRQSRNIRHNRCMRDHGTARSLACTREEFVLDARECAGSARYRANERALRRERKRRGAPRNARSRAASLREAFKQRGVRDDEER